MDWLTFSIRLLEAAAWPVVAVALVLLLRTEIRTLVPHIKRLKAGPLEAEFERELKELRAEASSHVQALPMPQGLTPERQALLQLVHVNPRSAIIEAWRGVEIAAVRLIDAKAIYVAEKEARSPLAVGRAIAKAGSLSADELALYHDLRALRNQAAHVPQFEPTADAALDYVELAGRLQAALARSL